MPESQALSLTDRKSPAISITSFCGNRLCTLTHNPEETCVSSGLTSGLANVSLELNLNSLLPRDIVFTRIAPSSESTVY